MHVTDTDGHAVTGIEVVPRATADHESEGEILSLRQPVARRTLRVNKPGSASQLKVGSCPPVPMDEITPRTQTESPIFCLRSSRDCSKGQGQCEVGVAA